MQDQVRKEEENANSAAEAVRKRQIRNSVLLAVLLAVVFLILYLICRPSKEVSVADDASLKAVIQVEGEQVHSMELDQDASYTVRTADGGYNTVVVKDQSVRVSEADCENQVCVKTGAVRYPGEVIACMPHRLIISVES